METSKFENEEGSFAIARQPGGVDVTIQGDLRRAPESRQIHYMAAAPMKTQLSFSGTGLPFMSREQALDGSPNIGTVTCSRLGHFKIVLKMPGSYYVGLGTTLVPPTVFLSWHTKKNGHVATHVPLGRPIAYRVGTYPPLRSGSLGPLFYEAPAVAKTLPRTQEQILRDGAYPWDGRTEAPDFWGLRPAR
jgi:hypothetical protein